MQSYAYLGFAVMLLATGIIYADPTNDAQAAISQAEAMRKKADALGGEWRDTNSLIQQAQAALNKGEVNNAQALTTQAQQQAELGYQQALKNKKADFPEYLR